MPRNIVVLREKIKSPGFRGFWRGWAPGRTRGRWLAAWSPRDARGWPGCSGLTGQILLAGRGRPAGTKSCRSRSSDCNKRTSAPRHSDPRYWPAHNQYWLNPLPLGLIKGWISHTLRSRTRDTMVRILVSPKFGGSQHFDFSVETSGPASHHRILC